MCIKNLVFIGLIVGASVYADEVNMSNQPIMWHEKDIFKIN